jgi:hypothetical protein
MSSLVASRHGAKVAVTAATACAQMLHAASASVTLCRSAQAAAIATGAGARACCRCPYPCCGLQPALPWWLASVGWAWCLGVGVPLWAAASFGPHTQPAMCRAKHSKVCFGMCCCIGLVPAWHNLLLLFPIATATACMLR